MKAYDHSQKQKGVFIVASCRVVTALVMYELYEPQLLFVLLINTGATLCIGF